MKNKITTITILAAILLLVQYNGFAQTVQKNVKLHVSTKWKDCSFQLDPSLTQDAWRQFTREAGLVSYFRPLADASSIGVGNYEFSLLQWETEFDDTKPAWNDTFVHPDSMHWLKDGERLPMPGFIFRTGIAKNIDGGIYFSKNPNANYGLWGGMVQYAFLNDNEFKWDAAARLNFNSLFGPEDVDLSIVGLDLLASKDFQLYSDWLSLSGYAGLSFYFASSHEKSNVVDLTDENVFGSRGFIGAITKISLGRIAFEYNFAAVNSISIKLGVEF